jgi:uncharacterized protein
MRIRVDEIPESGRFLHFHWDQDRLGQFLPPDDPFELELLHPVNVDLEINKGADHIRIQGSIKGVLQVACHRCLKPFPMPLDEQVEVFLVEEQKAPEEEEKELEEEDLEYEFFDGEVIEIDELVAEQIFLALPFKVLCSEGCRGLCPRCGANLNDEPCKCEQKGDNSPFARLKAIKDRLPEAADPK